MRFVVWAFSATPLSCPTAYSSTLAFQVSFSLSLMGWTRFFLSELLKLSPQQSLTFTLHSGSARCFHGQLLWTTRKSRRRAGTASLSRDDVFPALLAQQHVREQILAGWQPTLSITSGELSSFGHAPPSTFDYLFQSRALGGGKSREGSSSLPADEFLFLCARNTAHIAEPAAGDSGILFDGARFLTSASGRIATVPDTVSFSFWA